MLEEDKKQERKMNEVIKPKISCGVNPIKKLVFKKDKISLEIDYIIRKFFDGALLQLRLDYKHGLK